jgi:hypothetical protein
MESDRLNDRIQKSPRKRMTDNPSRARAVLPSMDVIEISSESDWDEFEIMHPLLRNGNSSQIIDLT